MSTFAATLSILIVVGLLLFDSVGFYAKSIKYLYIDSRLILVLFLTISTLAAWYDRYFISPVLLTLNKILSPFLFLASVGMVLGNYYLYTTFSLNSFNIDARNFIFVPLLSGYLLYLEYAKRLKLKETFAKLQYFGPPLLLIILIFIERYFNSVYALLEREDSAFETLQFIGYLFSGLLWLHIANKLFTKKLKMHALLFMLLGLMLLFIAGEEISWGQRYLGIATPDYIAQNNLQKEITLHNNKYVQFKTYFLYMAIGLYGSFGWLALKFLPKKLSKSWSLFIPQPKLFFYFFPAFAFFFFSWYLSTYYGLFDAQITSFDPWQELAELYVAAGFLQFTLRNTTMLKTTLKK